MNVIGAGGRNWQTFSFGSTHAFLEIPFAAWSARFAKDRAISLADEEPVFRVRIA